MGAGVSQALPDLTKWVGERSSMAPKPTLEEVNNSYAKVVKYAYANPQKCDIYLADIQKRFFNTNCIFLWSWSEARPKTPFSSIIQLVDVPSLPGEAIEAYRMVVENITPDILSDMQIRYFDQRYTCNLRVVQNTSEYQTHFDPVFR